MLVRIVIAVLLIAGPLPFRSCACDAHHVAESEPASEHERAEHDPACTMARPPSPKPAVTASTADLDDGSAFGAGSPFDPPLVSSPKKPDTRTSFDTARPRWLVHLAIQV